SVEMRATSSSTSDSALIGSKTERALSRGGGGSGAGCGSGEMSSAKLGSFPDEAGTGGFLLGTGGGLFGSGGFEGAGVGTLAFGSGGGIDFFPGSGGGIVDFFGGAGASSCALGSTISDVGTAFIIFEGGSPDAI
ncbi:MAG TPA: hypothetical protein VH142_17155, partial [Polyangiaceae bacterium]|nr:hypothetical protein [Polyangiaceae bacterium]